ncbi:MAG: hypothetical protein K2X93_08285 [Candidatus Obscuribacterales bacterium]|nr:hypothetical protein [Candidatus Obscuribacterales bacterium]
MTEISQHLRLGDLLLEAGILSSTYIKDALARFEEDGLPIGKALVISGYLSDGELRNALSIQYMVNDRLLTREAAVEVLRTAHGGGLTLEESFRKTGLVQPEEQETNKLGQLLVDSDNITEEAVELSLEANSATGLPLGHILCQKGLISQQLINRALTIQQHIRRGQVIRDQGIDSLKLAGEREAILMTLQINRGFKKQPLKGTPLFADLLLNAGVVTDRQVREALLAHITINKPIGQAFVAARLFSEQFVLSAVAIQEMMDNGTLELDRAREALIEIRTKGVSAMRAASEACTFRLQTNQSRQLIALLHQINVLDINQIPTEMQERAIVNYNQVMYICRALLSNGMVDENTLYSSLRLVDMLTRGKIDEEKAAIALEFAARSNTDVEYALYMLGVTERTRLQEQEIILSQ